MEGGNPTHPPAHASFLTLLHRDSSGSPFTDSRSYPESCTRAPPSRRPIFCLLTVHPRVRAASHLSPAEPAIPAHDKPPPPHFEDESEFMLQLYLEPASWGTIRRGCRESLTTHAVTSRCRQRQPSASLRELPQPRCSPASPVSLHRFASPLRILHPRTPPPQRRPPPPETTFPPDRCSVVRWAQVRCMCRSARSGTPRRGSTSSSSSAGAPGSGCSSLPPPSPH